MVKINRRPVQGNMTALTIRCCGNMSWILGRCYDPVMATLAVAQNLIMIHIYRGPVRCHMAILTDIGC